MHVNIFSFIKQPSTGYALAPAYNMIAIALVVTDDKQELALNMNGKKRKVGKKVFDALMGSFKLLNTRSFENIYTRFTRAISQWKRSILQNFLLPQLQEMYIQFISERGLRLWLF